MTAAISAVLDDRPRRLHAARRAPRSRASASEVRRLAREREVQVDDVQRRGPRGQARARRRDRIAAVAPRPGPGPSAASRASRPPATSIAGITSNATSEPYRRLAPRRVRRGRRVRCARRRRPGANAARRGAIPTGRRGRSRPRRGVTPFGRDGTGPAPARCPDGTRAAPSPSRGRPGVHAAAGRSTSRCPERRARRRRPQVGLADLVRADLQLAAAQVDPAGDQHDAVGLDQARARPRRRRERHHLAPPARPSSRNCAYGSPRFVYLRWTRADDPADRHEVAVAERLEVADLVRRLRREQRPRTPSSGWSVTNCPSISFSSRSSVRLSNSSPSSTDSSTSVTPDVAAEQRELPRGLGLALGEDRPRRPCPGSPDQRASRRAYPSESNAPAKISALQDALREHRRLDLAAEVRERRERALPAPRVDDLADGALPDVAHGRQPVADRAVGSPGAGAKSISDSLTSGGRTSMPMPRHAFR